MEKELILELKVRITDASGSLGSWRDAKFAITSLCKTLEDARVEIMLQVEAVDEEIVGIEIAGAHLIL